MLPKHELFSADLYFIPLFLESQDEVIMVFVVWRRNQNVYFPSNQLVFIVSEEPADSQSGLGDFTMSLLVGNDLDHGHGLVVGALNDPL